MSMSTIPISLDTKTGRDGPSRRRRLLVMLTLMLGLAVGLVVTASGEADAASEPTATACFTTTWRASGGYDVEVPYALSPVRLQTWYGGGPYTISNLTTNRYGCIMVPFVTGWWWRLHAYDTITVNGFTSTYSGVTNWTYSDGYYSHYNLGTVKVPRT